MYILPTTLLKRKKEKRAVEGRKEEGERKGQREGGLSGPSAYLVKLTFLDISGFNSGVPSIVGQVVHL